MSYTSIVHKPSNSASKVGRRVALVACQPVRRSRKRFCQVATLQVISNSESVNPLNRYSDGLLPFLPPGRTPLPVNGKLDQSGSNRVLVHAGDFFFKL